MGARLGFIFFAELILAIYSAICQAICPAIGGRPQAFYNKITSIIGINENVEFNNLIYFIELRFLFNVKCHNDVLITNIV